MDKKELSNRINEIKSNPKQRMMYLTILGAMGVMAAGAIWFASKDDQAAVPSGASLVGVPNVAATPGSSNSLEYNKKLDEDNRIRSEEAIQTGETFVPVLTNQEATNVVSPIDLAAQEQERIRKEREQEELRLLEEQKRKLEEEKAMLEAAVAQQAQQVQQEQVQPVVQQVVQQPPEIRYVVKEVPVYIEKKEKTNFDMEDALIISQLMENQRYKTSVSERDYFRQDAEKNVTSETLGQQTGLAQQGLQGVGGYNAEIPDTVIAKAGTISHAVLLTGVNSDEPSPVMAKIVSGKLKDSVLLGSVQLVGKKVVLQFTSINVPNLDRTVQINAVAVDAETSRTALATDVDNHYFLKYGLLIASSFLQGWSNAITANNSESTVTPFGGIVTTPKGGLSQRDINKQALGQVGAELVNDVRSEFNGIKPTVKVDQGIAMGILFMDDFIVENN